MIMAICSFMSTLPKLPIDHTARPIAASTVGHATLRGERGWKAGGAGLGPPAPAAPQDRNGRADELLHNLASGCITRPRRESRDTWRVQGTRGEFGNAYHLAGG